MLQNNLTDVRAPMREKTTYATDGSERARTRARGCHAVVCERCPARPPTPTHNLSPFFNPPIPSPPQALKGLGMEDIGGISSLMKNMDTDGDGRISWP